jgi:hypothetical protein
MARVSGDKQPAAAKGNKNGRLPEGRVFLFSGYMVDFPGKVKKTFPANKEKEIREDIVRTLEKHNAGPGDIAILAGLSAGSEILFAEVCAEKGIHVNIHLPLPESKYIREFVSIAGESWVDRFYKICSHPDVDEFYQLEQVGLPKKNDDPYERNNRWALYSSLIRGISKATLIAVWNNIGGRAKDRDEYLTQHMVDLMRETGGKIEAINTTRHLFEDSHPSPAKSGSSAPKKAKKSSKK